MAQPRRPKDGQETARLAQPTIVGEAPPPPPATATLAGPDIEQMLDTIFLSPRVVDQRGFEELADSLRGLARDAAAQNRTLLTTTADVDRLSDSLRQATHELHTRLETAARLMPTLEARVQKAEGLIDQTGSQLDDRLREIKAVASDDFKLDRERIAERVRAEVTSVVAKLIEEQIRDGRRRLAESGAAELARVRGELETMTSQATRLREGVARAAEDAARATLERVTNEAASLLERVDQSRGALGAALGAANDRAASIFEQTSQRLADLASDTLADCTKLTKEATCAAETALARTREIAQGVDRSCDAAELRLSSIADREAERVQACSDRAEAAAEVAKAIEGDLREGASKTARGAVLAVREQIGDILAGAHEDLRRAREAALDSIEQAGSNLDDQSRQVRDELDAHAAACVGRLRPLLDEAEEAELSQKATREVMSQLCDQVHTNITELRADLDHAIEQARKRIDHAARGPALLLEAFNAAHARAGEELAGATASLEEFALRAARQHAELLNAAEHVEARLRGLDLTGVASRLAEVLDRNARVEGLAREAAQAAVSADTALKNLESFRAQAEQARRQLGDSIVDGASKIDTLEADIDSLVARIEEARANAHAPVTPLTPALIRQANDLGARLSQIVAQADLMGQGLDELLRLAKARLDKPPGKPSRQGRSPKPDA